MTKLDFYKVKNVNFR